MAARSMNIIPVCPFCAKPLTGKQHDTHYTFLCVEREVHEGHMYGASAATEAEARAIVLKPQKYLLDALSAKIALPIEQRRHAELRQRYHALRITAGIVAATLADISATHDEQQEAIGLLIRSLENDK